MSSNILVYLMSALFLAVLVAVLSFLRANHIAQKEAQLKADQTMRQRCERLVKLIQIIPERYLDHSIRLSVLDYSINGYSYLNGKYSHSEQTILLKEALRYREELADQEARASREKVVSEKQLLEIQNAQQALVAFLKWQLRHQVIDNATTKIYIDQIRYRYALANIDFLIYQANSLEEQEKRAKALEKYRTALAEVDKMHMWGDCQALEKQLKTAIESLEQQLLLLRNAAK